MSTTCSCGCCGNRTTSGCIYSDLGRTPTEIVCSASGGVSNIEELSTVWNHNNCPNTYSLILFTNPSGTLEYNSANLARVQADIDHLMTTYTKDYGFTFTANTNSPTFNPFQNQLISLCSDVEVPG